MGAMTMKDAGLIGLLGLALCGVGAALWAWRDPVRALNAFTHVALAVQGRLGPVQLDQAYGPADLQRTDVYLPPSSLTRPPEGWPVVVFFHGGSWVRGQRSEYRFVGQALASRGVVAVVADYRLYPQVRYPDFLRDSAAAVAWAVSRAPAWQADAQRVFTMGHSAGAYNAAMLAVDARWLREAGLGPFALAGWVGLAGPYDFLPIQDEEVKPVFGFPHSPPDSQVLFHAHAGAPPAWLALAPQDPYVDPGINSIRLFDRLRALGVNARLRVVPQASHASLVGMLSPMLNAWVPLLDEVSAFVRNPPEGPSRVKRPVFSSAAR